MKKLFIITALILGNLIPGFSQVKADSNFVIPRNNDFTTQTKDGFTVTASDVYSKLSKLKRKIQIFDKNNTLVGEAYIRLESLNPTENIYDKINTDPDHFSGVLTIEIDGQAVYLRTINNGVATYQNRQVPGPVYNPNLSCTIGHVHDCVAYNIDEMNWVRYILCLIGAPKCYITQWLSCQWEVCHNHMEYTNPN